MILDIPTIVTVIITIDDVLVPIIYAEVMQDTATNYKGGHLIDVPEIEFF